MITEYHRPETVDEALLLLNRSGIESKPLGGGTTLSKAQNQTFAVVDLQKLGMNQIQKIGNGIIIGSGCTLQQLVENPMLPDKIRQAALGETTKNIRNAATIGGLLMKASGRSVLTAVLMAMDAQISLLPENQSQPLGDWLTLHRKDMRGKIIQDIRCNTMPVISVQTSRRTPADWAQVLVVVVMWQGGRVRVITGGWGEKPQLAMDGSGVDGALTAVVNSFCDAEDEWASAAYRKAAGAALLKRGLAELGMGGAL